jgi:hypothetical protein
MIGYLTFGTADLERAGRSTTPLLAEMGVTRLREARPD